jgi:hypothetical protein
MFVCAISMMDRVSVNQNAEDTNKILRVMYKSITKLALKLEEFQTAVEFGTKLVALNDVVLTDFMMECEYEDPNYSNLEALDMKDHYECHVLLANAAAALGDRNVLIHAYVRCLDLVAISDRLFKHGSHCEQRDECRPLILDKPLETQLDLCINVLRANDVSKGDAFLSVKHGRKACELDVLLHLNSGSNEIMVLKPFKHRLEMLFLTGKALYKLALQLSGGLTMASSPPIAIRTSSHDPSVKDLLEDSMRQLKDAEVCLASMSDSKEAPKTTYISARALSIQIAILHIELRHEAEAKEVLTHLEPIAPILTVLASRKKLPADLDGVLFSTSVIRRLQGLSRHDKRIEIHRKPSNLLLKRMSSMQFNVTCSYCCMNVRDPIDCDECSAVHYCTEECKLEHAEQHSRDCKSKWF